MTEFKCPRRAEGWPGTAPIFARDNDYDEARDACGYCGSLNPAVFMARLEAGTIALGTTDKDYKVYVSNYGGEPLRATKFYFQHLDGAQQARFVALFNERRLKFQGEFGFYVMPFFCRRADHGRDTGTGAQTER